jgi:hypothetical protein
MTVARQNHQRTVTKPNRRWARQRPSYRGGNDDITAPPAPTVTSITPSSVAHGVATTSFAVVGTNFKSGAMVVTYTAPSTSAKTVTPVVADTTHLSFTIPAGDLDLAGTVTWVLDPSVGANVTGSPITIT